MALVDRRDEGGIVTLTLNRPEALNALSPSLFVELRTHVDDIAAATETVGCVILTGAGRSFSAGNDLKALGERPPSPHFQAETIEALENLPQPTIAGVRGHCFTGGFELALGCDLIVAAEGARFADTHGKWGMSPTWGMSQRLPRRVGVQRAKEIMFSGREVGGAEAAATGLAIACVPDDALDATVNEMAERIVANSWFTLRTDKALVHGGLGLEPAAGLRYERENSPGAGPDMEQRLQAFFNRS